jgi:16S rRNA (cytosine967-C5)-methyltransferase
VAAHAAVHETVELVKLHRRGAAGLVNAVLRRTVTEGSAVLAELDDHDAAHAAVLHSLPAWLAERWWQELGADEARALMRRVNEPAESALRVNTLRASREEVLARLPVPAHGVPELPEGLVLEGPFDAHSSELFSEGAIMPQSRASMLVARVLDPQPGERVLDLCAAPGAKTTDLSALMDGRGELVAVERHSGRAAALARTCLRMGATSVRVEVADAVTGRPDGPFDRVLVDPPCSGLGTLQSRPDLRWRASPDAITELAELQGRILTAAAAVTAPGGTLLYSVCTISAAESELVLDRFLAQRSGFVVEDLQREHPQWRHPRHHSYLQLLPHRDGTDGFFLARLRRPSKIERR